MKKLLLSLGLIAASSAAFAATYQVYNEPNTNAKVVSQLTDQNQNQYIQFYQQGNWIKVADTQTGQVGWVNTAQIKHAQMQTQYQQAVNALNMQQKQLEEQRKAFEQRYQQAAQNIQHQMQQLQQQMKQASSQNTQAQKAVQPVQNNIPANASGDNTKNTNQVQRSFHAVSIQTNKDGKTATVTREWLGKDGKMQKEVKQVPVSELQKMSLNF
ncbi:SH3 domain-containing protein [Cysteiniphilum halobium]|uniref:SH3 domain-containing protein n=1 Tax=Cysteiniphilum halobium TaxID=2219059 RepID=UPI000E658535|nr:SH3 domain-containing protein [Cysteiniphilum halobium]